MYLVKCALVFCVALAVTSGSSLSTNDVIFHLFTRSNPQQSEQLFANVGSIISSSFSISRRTVFTIHNHGETAAGNFNAFVIPAELQGDNVNIIAVDWSRGSKFYTVGLANSRQAGVIIANFVNILINNFGYKRELIKIIGVGLGGHVAGIAARNVNGVIPHIIALDPSLYGWSYNPDTLSRDDAEVVEVLHTTAGIRGYDEPLGHLDFYPNGGSFQNGCASDPNCSHILAYAFYAESVTAAVYGNPQFVGTACQSYDEAITLQCSGTRDVSFGGRATKSGNSGIYVFTTNASPPFARG